MKSTLLKLSLLGLPLICATGNAHAQGTIVYHNPPDVGIFSGGSPTRTYEIDLDGGGQVDFVFEASRDFQVYSTTGGRSVGIPAGGLDLGSESIPLLDGFSIDSDLPAPLQWTSSVDWPFSGWVGARMHTRNSAGSAGYWNPPPLEYLTAFVGVEFAIAQYTHYGWVRVEVFGPPGNGGTIMDWAYNSVAGQPILAGQVPEPGTMALIAIGSGFVWLIGRTRRPE